MFTFLPALFAKFFPHVAKCVARRRETRYAASATRRRQARYIHPRIEDLEERMVLDAYSFINPVTGNPSIGSYTDTTLWTDFTNPAKSGVTVPGAGDIAAIPTGAVCTLDSSEDHSLTALSVAGTLTTKSMLTVSGGTTVAPAGFLHVTAPDISGVDSTLETGKLITGPGTTTNFTIGSSGEVDIDSSATLAGASSITGVLKAKNIDAFTGASVTFTGAATISSGPIDGNLDAGENASFTFAPGSAVILASGATLGDGKFIVEAPLAVNTALVTNNSEFTLENDGFTTFGSIGGTGSIDFWNHEFDWEGGTIGGLTGGGFTIDGNADLKLSGADAKTLATTMLNFGDGTADFDGTGTLTLAPSGTLINNASAVLPMELSLPVLSKGTATLAGTFVNNGYLDIGSVGTGVVIATPLNNTAAGVIDLATGAGPLSLTDNSGTSLLNGKIGLNNGTLTISGIYTTSTGFEEEFSANDVTTLAGSLVIDSGVSADFDHLIVVKGGSVSGADSITGAGDLSINGGGVDNGDYLKWMSGTISGSGSFTDGSNATLWLIGSGTLKRNLDVQGTVKWLDGSTFALKSTVHVEKGGVFDFEDGLGGTVSTMNNDGTLEVGAGDGYSGDTLMLGTFTQSSTGKLQIDMVSDTSYGSLRVAGAATLDGTLDGNLENGYQPASGTHFTVLNCASRSGEFATVDPQGWTADYSSSSVDLVSS